MQIINKTKEEIKVAGFKIPAGASLNIHNSFLDDKALEGAEVSGTMALFNEPKTETKTKAKAKPKTKAK